MSVQNLSICNSGAWRIGKHYFADPARRAAARLVRGDRVPLFWFDIPNWGDALNPYLVRLLSSRNVQHLQGFYHDRYLAIGSILGSANERSEVWGSGFIKSGERVRGRPKAVYAVRGPLSRDALLKQGIPCPEIYGDPALLLPWFFNPEVDKKYAVGIVCNFVDNGHPWIEHYRGNPDILIVDVEANTEEFIRSIKSCETILSGSLHGLIAADSYGIPNLWVKFSDEMIGGNFKFIDYRLSIGAEIPRPYIILPKTCANDLASLAQPYAVNLDLHQLLLACPFLSDQCRKHFCG
jgi:pyruvyltransferase